jgi:hypothetical protein
MRLAVWPVWMFGEREMRPSSILDVDLVITFAIPVICERWHGHRDIIAFPCEETLEAMDEPFQVAILSLLMALMVFSPFTDLSFKDTLGGKLLSVEFQARKLQRLDSCAKRREIESCR